jgi:dTDP-4-dehydrorhamnose reductase
VRIAVTGLHGQVAQSLAERAREHAGIEVMPIGRPHLALEDPGTILPALDAVEPDLVVSAAAYTAVDLAEDEPALAHAVNAAGAGHVAAAAARLGVPVVHLSTDYVFDGTGDAPHGEDDAPNPRSVYGKTKLEGEIAVARENPQHLILRTAWVYSPFGRNFVKTMLSLAAQRDALNVVADQWGNPTSALDIADGILRAAHHIERGGSAGVWGTCHLVGGGEANWSGLARHVLDTSRTLGGPFADIRDITTEDYPTKAPRPRNSRLSSGRFSATFGWTPPEWRQSVEVVVRRLLEHG